MSKRHRIATRIVADGYDRIAERYAQWSTEEVVDEVRPRYTRLLLDSLPVGADVLDLGCGGGGPTTRAFAERFSVTGVDISRRQIELARANVPLATFLRADMSALALPPASFDGIAAFYCLTHLPQGELPRQLRRVAEWLRPDGMFVGSLATRMDPGTVDDDWLGAPMYFSGHPTEDNVSFVEAAGLTIIGAQPETISENGRPTTFLWVVARKA